MKENKYFLNTALAAVVGVAVLACVLIRTFAPTVVLPVPDVPNVVLLSLLALVADHYIAPGAKRCWLCIPVLGGLTFGLLVYLGGFLTGLEALKLGVLGGGIFTAVTWLYTSIQDRLSTGPAAKAAPVMSALVLYLASQVFMGMGV